LAFFFQILQYRIGATAATAKRKFQLYGTTTDRYFFLLELVLAHFLCAPAPCRGTARLSKIKSKRLLPQAADYDFCV